VTVRDPRWTIDFHGLKAFLDAIGSTSRYLVQDFGPDQRLYHYTDLAALKGIVEKHDLWLTHLRYSNDDRELTHGYDVAKEVIARERVKRKNRDRGLYFEEIARRVDEEPAAGVFICCFCARDNLLSQWRSYGANGTGVSVGFDPVGFTPLSGQDLPPNLGLMRLWRVFYKPETQRRIVRQALDLIPRLHPAGSEEDWAQRAADAIHFFAPTFKVADFAEERERRLIFTPAPDCPVKPSYRVGRGMLAPYYRLAALAEGAGRPIQTLPIRRVTVGPSVHKAMNLESTRMMLAQNGYAEPTVTAEASTIPYRG
jgi:hypothetical protein